MRRNARGIIWGTGVNQHHASDFVWIFRGIELRDIGAKGMSDQNVGAGNVRIAKQGVQLVHTLAGITRRWPRFTPAKASSVIDANLGALGDFRLHQSPLGRIRRADVIQNHRRIASGCRTRTVDVHLVAAHIHHLTWRRKGASVKCGGNDLVRRAAHSQGDQCDQQS